jgi:trigger factor
MGMDMTAFRNGFKKQAENQVKLRLALEKVAEFENITISDEKVDEEINKMAKAYNVDADKIKSYVSLKNIQEDLMVAEASKLIKESAKFIG